jgi:hypothetical protein
MSRGIFLPVGHTHFDADRVARESSSRLAMKYRDVTALSELESILEGFNNPSPFVDTIEAVTDISDSEGDADADVDVEEELEEESSEEDFGN